MGSGGISKSRAVYDGKRGYLGKEIPMSKIKRQEQKEDRGATTEAGWKWIKAKNIRKEGPIKRITKGGKGWKRIVTRVMELVNIGIR